MRRRRPKRQPVDADAVAEFEATTAKRCRPSGRPTDAARRRTTPDTAAELPSGETTVAALVNRADRRTCRRPIVDDEMPRPTGRRRTLPPAGGTTTDTPGQTPSGETADGETPADGETTETPAEGSTGSTGTPAAGDAAFEARRQELINELENWQPSAGMDSAAAEARRTELLQQVRQAQPVAGQSLEASFPPVRSDPLLFNTGVVGPRRSRNLRRNRPPTRRQPPADDGTGRRRADSGRDSSASDAADNPDPAVTLPNPLGETGLHTADGLPDGVQNLAGASGLVDDFDAMAGIGGDARPT